MFMKVVNYLLTFVILFGSFCFSSCESDEPYEQDDSSMLVSSIIYYYDNSCYDYYNFIYDSDNRVIRSNFYSSLSEEESIITFSYSPFSICINEGMNSVLECRTNEKGYIVEVNEDQVYFNYKYNGDYLSQEIFVYDGNEDIYNYYWNDGNLVKVTYEGYKEDVCLYVQEFLFEYNETSKMNTGIYLPIMMHRGMGILPMLYSGAFGKTSSKIPTKTYVKYNEGNSETISNIVDINVVLDNKGRIIEYIENGNVACKFSYDERNSID